MSAAAAAAAMVWCGERDGEERNGMVGSSSFVRLAHVIIVVVVVVVVVDVRRRRRVARSSARTRVASRR